MMPNLIIIGPGKTGTTFLHRHLASHSQIQTTRIKETNAFLKENPEKQFENNKLLKDSNFKYKYLVDSSVRYFNLPDVKIKELKNVLDKKTRVICILRNPYDRMQSQLIQYLKTGKITKESDVLDILNCRFEYSYNDYEKNVSGWNKYFDIQIYDYEILKKNPQKFINQVFSDLELNIEKSLNIKIVNKRSDVRYKALAKIKNNLKQYSLNHDNILSVILIRLSQKLNSIYERINSKPYNPDNQNYNSLIQKSKVNPILLKSLVYYKELF